MLVNVVLGMIFRGLPPGGVKDAGLVFQKAVMRSTKAQALLKTAYPDLKERAARVRANQISAQTALSEFLQTIVGFDLFTASTRDALVTALANPSPGVERALRSALGYIK